MRHFRTLLAALLAIVGATTGVAQTTYNLWLAGTQVTSNHLSGDPTSAVVNVTGISGVTGTVKLRVASQYGIDSYRLYLENVTITNTSNTAAHKEAIYMSGVGTQIRLTGTNTVSSTYAAAIDIHSNLKKEIRNNNADDPDASLTATGTTGIYVGDPSGEVIESEAYLLIGTALTAQGTNGYGIVGSVAASDGSSQNGLTIAGANYSPLYQVKAKGTQGAVCHFSGLSYLYDMALVQPTGARFLNEQVCDAIGNPIAGDTWVVFDYLEPEPEPYAFIQGSILTFCYDTKRATIANQYTVYDIPDDGTLPGWANKTNVTQAWFTDSFDNYQGLTSTCRMFYGLSNLTQITGLDNLHTDNVTDMSFMFCDCSSLTSLDLTSFNTSNVTKMGSMFRDCSSLESLNVSSFNTSAIKTYTSGAMSSMFEGCSSLTQLSLINFTIGKYYLDRMFFGCSSLETIYCDKTWSPATSDYMFQGCTSLYSESSGLHYDNSKIDSQYANPDKGYFTLPAMAAYAILNGSTLTFYYDNLSTQRTGTMYTLTWAIAPSWAGNSAITTATFDESFANYHNLVHANYMFGNLSNLTQINNLRYLNTENVTNMVNMFSGCTQLTELDLSSFNTSAVTSMKSMFQGDTNLTTIYVGANWSTASVQFSTSMFTGCTSLVGQNGTTYDVNHVTAAYAHVDAAGNPGYFTHEKEAYAVWNGGFLLTFYYDGLKSQRGTGSASVMSANWKTDTNERPGWYNNDQITTVSFDSSFGQYHGLTYLGHMFEGMDRLAAINGLQYLNTENVTYMNSMFQECPALTALDLSHFNTANVTSMWGMFQGCTALTSLDLSSFNTAKVTNMQNMFWGCTGLQKLFLTDFTTPKNPSTNKMFYNCSGLILILCNNTWTASSSADMFTGCTHLVGGVGTAFTTDHIDAGYARPDGGTVNPGYFTEKKIQPYALYGPNLGLTFYYDDQKYLRTNDSGEAYAPSDYYDFPWSGTYPSWTPAGGETWRNINKVVFDSSFQNYTGLTSTSYMFYGMNYLTTIEHLDYLNTENVTDMSHMFEGCVNLQTLDTYNISANSVTDMSSMFYGCARLTSLNLQNFNPQQATKATSMFQGCSALTYIYSPNDWKTAKLTNSTNMFTGCTSLRSPNLSYDEGKVSATYANPTTGYFFSRVSDPYPYAVLSADQKTLTFYYNTAYRWAEGTVYFMNWGPGVGYPGWTSEDGNETIETVTFDASFQNYHGLTSGYKMFYKMSALTQINHLDYLNTENVNIMALMFEGCSNLTSLDLSHFNTAKVTEMSWMFYGCTSLTSLDLSHFNTENVTNMGKMFEGCSKLTSLNLSSFNTEKVTSMYMMFYHCTSLMDLDVSNFNTEKVTLMAYMFDGCSSLTSLDLSHFNTAKVTSMNFMFDNCSALTDLSISNFNTDKVTDMYMMFRGCSKLTSLDLSSFNTANVTNMYSMFLGCSSLQTIYCNDDWNTSTVTNSAGMFKDCTHLVGGNGTAYSDAHYDIAYAHPDATGNPGYFTTIQKEAYALLSTDGKTLTFYYDDKRDARTGTKYDLPWTGTYPGWAGTPTTANTSITTVTFDSSFRAYSGLTNASCMFYNMTALTQINHLDYLNTENVTNMSLMFYQCGNVENIDVSHFNTANVTDLRSMFNRCSKVKSLDLSHFNTDKVTTMNAMFFICSALENLDLTNFNTANVTDMSSMFYNCPALESLDLTNFNTAKVTNMSSMFTNCSSLQTIYCNDDWNRSTVTNSSGMFSGCTNLVGGNGTRYNANNVTAAYARPDAPGSPGYFTSMVAYALLSTDGATLTFYYDDKKDTREGTKYGLPWTGQIPDWAGTDTDANTTITTATFDTSFQNYHGLTNTSYMFNKMTALTQINHLDYLNTEDVTDMKYMFNGCSALQNLDVTGFDTGEVTDMYAMFSNCSELTSLDLSHFNTANVTTMAYMFNGCSNLTNLNVSNFNTAKVTNMFGMFSYCSALTELDVLSFNTSNVENMTRIFDRCSSLTTLDLSGFDTHNVTDMGYMFYACMELTTIYVGEGWDMSRVTDSIDMFPACYNLVGGAGTAYDGVHFHGDYAHIDGGTANPGYFTATTVEAYAVVDGATLTFYYDNLKDTRAGTKYGLNTGDDVPAWNASKGTVLHVVFDASFADARPTTTYSWFDHFEILTDIQGLENLNTENVTNMHGMFNGCYKLTTLDLSGFDTHNVTDLGYLFYACMELTTIYVGEGWDMSRVTDSIDMFPACYNLVGGAGTAYDGVHFHGDYAHIDGGTANPGYFSAKSTYSVGDVNKDGKITIADVTALVNIILGKTTTYEQRLADVNKDNKVTIADVTALVNIILGK